MDFDDDNDFGQDEEEFGDFGEPDDIFIRRLPESPEVQKERRRREMLSERKFSVFAVIFAIVFGAVVGALRGGLWQALLMAMFGLFIGMILVGLMNFISHAED